jgi:hypothetical protein
VRDLFGAVQSSLRNHKGTAVVSMMASVQPSGDTASNSSARRRVAGGLRLRFGIGGEIPSVPCYPTAA